MLSAHDWVVKFYAEEPSPTLQSFVERIMAEHRRHEPKLYMSCRTRSAFKDFAYAVGKQFTQGGPVERTADALLEALEQEQPDTAPMLAEEREGETILNRILRSLETHSKHINERLDKMASAIQDFAAKVQANFDKTTADLDGISTELAALHAQIVALQDSPGTLSKEDQAALDAISDKSAALVAKADALVLPAVPPVPTTP